MAKAPSKPRAGKAPLTNPAPGRGSEPRLAKRVVEKPDGRYLIFFEKK